MTTDLTARTQPAKPDTPRDDSLIRRITEILRGQFPLNGNDVHAHVAALIAEAAEQHYRPKIETVQELHALSTGVVVRSAAGTIAARFDREYGVVFGDDRPFPWIKMALPLVVLWSPGAGE